MLACCAHSLHAQCLFANGCGIVFVKEVGHVDNLTAAAAAAAVAARDMNDGSSKMTAAHKLAAK
jgi:hypothetical protein